MKVLFISGSFPPVACGVGDYLNSLVAALSSNPEIEVSVVTSALEQTPKHQSNSHVYPVIQNWGLGGIWKLGGLIHQIKPDIVHVQYPTHGYFISHARLRMLAISLIPALAFLMRKKVVQTWHEYENHGLLLTLYFLIRALAPSRIIVVRPDFKKHLSKGVRRLLQHKVFHQVNNASSIQKVEFTPDYLNRRRTEYLNGKQRIILFFGFIYPHKGVDLLFEIADPNTDQIIIAGGYDKDSAYISQLEEQIKSQPWVNQARMLGYIPTEEISLLLTIADAVVLPFQGDGGGIWNSSIHAALLHQVFVLTTSTTHTGYDPSLNIFYAAPNDVIALKKALSDYAGIRNRSQAPASEWAQIANAHIEIYNQMLKSGDPS